MKLKMEDGQAQIKVEARITTNPRGTTSTGDAS
jgi:hypothetical protein